MEIKKEKKKKNSKKTAFFIGGILVLLFGILTVLITTVDVQPVGQKGTNVGLAIVNGWFHGLTGVDMLTYTITDWLGLVPLAVCVGFGILGLVQLIKRKSLIKVDSDIIVLGVYYIIVIMAYIFFDLYPINYRPVLIYGFLEPSYPSSSVLLTLSVMPAFVEQIRRRSSSRVVISMVIVFSVMFSGYMFFGRLLAGVHWLTDIVGAVVLSVGLFELYRGFVLLFMKEKTEGDI